MENSPSVSRNSNVKQRLGGMELSGVSWWLFSAGLKLWGFLYGPTGKTDLSHAGESDAIFWEIPDCLEPGF